MKYSLLVLSFALLMPFSGLGTAESSKPNIILVMPDKVGRGDCACLGEWLPKAGSVAGAAGIFPRAR